MIDIHYGALKFTVSSMITHAKNHLILNIKLHRFMVGLAELWSFLGFCVSKHFISKKKQYYRWVEKLWLFLHIFQLIKMSEKRIPILDDFSSCVLKVMMRL